MDYQVVSIQTIENTTWLYLRCNIYAGDILVHKNDFVMQIRPAHTFYVGRPLDPDDPDDIPNPRDFVTIPNDARAEIIGNIERYVDRLSGRPGAPADSRDRRIRADDRDPLGLLARPDVTDLIGQRRRPPRP
jgi:hypothetical protein